MSATTAAAVAVAVPAAVVERTAMAARDGVPLATDVHRPATGRVPAILLRTPYGRGDLAQRARELDPLRAIEAGFAVVIQDMRGRGGSGGRFDANRDDVADGADAVAWIRGRPWSDGRVVTAGASYGGCAQWQVARARPEGLVAMAPTVSGALRTIWHPGGALRLSGIAHWVTRLLTERSERLGDGAERERLEALVRSPPLERLHAMVTPGSPAWDACAPIRHWVTLPPGDPFWTETTALPERPLSALHTTGWYDSCLEAAFDGYERWSAAGVPGAPQQLTIGPWDHGLDPLGYGELGGEERTEPAGGGVQARQLRFLRARLDGTEPDQPAAAVFVLGRSRWWEGERWPPPTRPLELRLSAEQPGDGRLTAQAPLSGGQLLWRHDPADPAPTLGGATSVAGRDGALDQGPLERRADVVTLTGGRLAAPLELAGRPRLALGVASSAVATSFFARLAVVLEDGRSLPLADGVWSGRLADLPRLGPAVPGRDCALTLTPLHVVVPAGARLRLLVGSSSAPELLPHPNVAHGWRDGLPQRGRVAVQRLLTAPSRLTLPVVGSSAGWRG